MERYIHGTTSSGPYGRIGVTDGMSTFLDEIGAVNYGAVLDAVRAVTNRFQRLSDYPDRITSDAPVSFRYAPMHLYRLRDMPDQIRPFCALGVTGMENRHEWRDSTYSDTVFFSYDEPLDQDGDSETGPLYFVDYVFGCRMMNWVDVRELRESSTQIDITPGFDRVNAEIRESDRSVIIASVRALYKGKSLVIVPERDWSFNARAKNILAQLYSMLPPYLARETGFAAYIDPNEISGLDSTTSVRVFVVSEKELPKVSKSDDLLILDLNTAPQEAEQNADREMKLIRRWTKMDHTFRQRVLSELFADTAGRYLEEELYYQRSEEFFSDPFFKWITSGNNPDWGTMDSLRQLRAKYESFPICQRLPFAKELFKEAIPRLLKGSVSLEDLCAAALSEAYDAELRNDPERKEQKLELYSFGKQMGGGNTDHATRQVATAVKTQRDEVAEYRVKQAIEDTRREYQGRLEESARTLKDKEAELEAEKLQGQLRLQEERRRAEEALAQHKAEAESILEATSSRADAAEREARKLRDEAVKLRGEADNYRTRCEIAETELNNARAQREAEELDDNYDRDWEEHRKRPKPLLWLLIGFLVGALISGAAVYAVLTYWHPAPPFSVETPAPATSAPEPTPEPVTTPVEKLAEVFYSEFDVYTEPVSPYAGSGFVIDDGYEFMAILLPATDPGTTESDAAESDGMESDVTGSQSADQPQTYADLSGEPSSDGTNATVTTSETAEVTSPEAGPVYIVVASAGAAGSSDHTGEDDPAADSSEAGEAEDGVGGNDTGIGTKEEPGHDPSTLSGTAQDLTGSEESSVEGPAVSPILTARTSGYIVYAFGGEAAERAVLRVISVLEPDGSELQLFSEYAGSDLAQPLKTLFGIDWWKTAAVHGAEPTWLRDLLEKVEGRYQYVTDFTVGGTPVAILLTEENGSGASDSEWEQSYRVTHIGEYLLIRDPAADIPADQAQGEDGPSPTDSPYYNGQSDPDGG